MLSGVWLLRQVFILELPSESFCQRPPAKWSSELSAHFLVRDLGFGRNGASCMVGLMVYWETFFCEVLAIAPRRLLFAFFPKPRSVNLSLALRQTVLIPILAAEILLLLLCRDEHVFLGPHQVGIEADWCARIFSCEVKLPPKPPKPSHPTRNRKTSRSLRHFIVPETVKKS